MGSKKLIFKAIFAQVQTPRAKMAEMCKNVLITVKVIDMVLIGGPESLLSLFQSIVQKLWVGHKWGTIGYNP